MNRASRAAAAVAALFLMSASAAAQQAGEPLGGKFIALCKSPNTAGRDTCGSVVIALMNAHVEMSRQNPDERVICPPRILSLEEGRRVFMQWTDTKASAAQMAFPDLVMAALLDRYPCSTYLKTPGSAKRK